LRFFSPQQIVREIAKGCLAEQELYVALIVRNDY
jgi:hypothetical protein